jgi:hypothetical protein
LNFSKKTHSIHPYILRRQGNFGPQEWEFNTEHLLLKSKKANELAGIKEQFIIFLNSLPPLGANWEISGVSQVSNDKMRTTKYSLIRNIPKEYLYKIAIHEIYPAIKFEWMDKTPDARKSLKFT